MGRLVLPASRELLASAVVSGESVDSALNKDEVKLGVLVLSVLLEMLADGHGLLDQVVQVLGELGSHTLGLQDSQNLGTRDALQLGDTHGVSQGDTDLRRGQTLLGQLAHVLDDVLRLDLQPRRRSALVRQSGARDTLTLSVNTSHVKRRLLGAMIDRKKYTETRNAQGVRKWVIKTPRRTSIIVQDVSELASSGYIRNLDQN